MQLADFYKIYENNTELKSKFDELHNQIKNEGKNII